MLSYLINSFITIFNKALLSEKKKEYSTAMEGYISCMKICESEKNDNSSPNEKESNVSSSLESISFFKDMKYEVMLRIGILKKDMGAIDQSMQMCNNLVTDDIKISIRANALCLKVNLYLFFHRITIYLYKL